MKLNKKSHNPLYGNKLLAANTITTPVTQNKYFLHFRQHLNTTRRPLLLEWRLITFGGTRWKQVNSRG